MKDRSGSLRLLFVLGFTLLGPLIWVLAQGFGIFGQDRGFGDAFGPDVSTLLTNSIWLALFTAIFATLLGFPLAVLLQRREFPGRRILGWLYFLPLVIPPHIHTIAWNRIIGNQGSLTEWFQTSAMWAGIVRFFADHLGIALWTTINVRGALMGREDADHFLFPLFSAIHLGPAWIMACAFFPLVTLATSSALRALDEEGLQAAKLVDGRRVFRTIIFPQIRGRVLSGALFVFVLALSTYPVVSLLNTPALINKVFVIFTQSSQSGGAALGLLLVGVAAIAIFVIAMLEPKGQRQGTVAPQPVQGGVASLLAVVGLLMLGFGMPLIALILQAGPISLDPGQIDNYQSVYRRGGIPQAFGNSLLMGLSGAAFIVLIAWPLARGLKGRGAGFIQGLGLSMLAVPSVLVGVLVTLFWTDLLAGAMPLAFMLALCLGLGGIGFVMRGARKVDLMPAGLLALTSFLLLLFLQNFAWFQKLQQEGLFLLWCAYLALFLPFVLRLMASGYRGIDPDELAAGQLAGRSLFVRIFRLEAPRLLPVILGSLVMGWVLCFTELAATLIVIRPGWASVQLRIFNMVHYRSIGEVSALCVMVILFAVIPVALLRLAVPRKWDVL